MMVLMWSVPCSIYKSKNLTSPRSVGPYTMDKGKCLLYLYVGSIGWVMGDWTWSSCALVRAVAGREYVIPGLYMPWCMIVVSVLVSVVHWRHWVEAKLFNWSRTALG